MPEIEGPTYTFKKRFIDDLGGFEIVYCNLNSGAEKTVNPDKPLFLEWLAAGNTPEEISYTPPVDTRTPRQKFLAELYQNFDRDELIEASIEKIALGNSATFDAIRAKILELKAKYKA